MRNSLTFIETCRPTKQFWFSTERSRSTERFVCQNNETATVFLYLMNSTEVSIKTPPAFFPIKG